MNIVANDQTTVLVVEDEALIGEMIADALVDRGFDVHLVCTAHDALRYMVSGGPVDVLFTDINIAGEIDGTVLARHVRNLRPDLPIVFASARPNLFDELRRFPRAACLPKPYGPAQVCAIVEGLFATKH